MSSAALVATTEHDDPASPSVSELPFTEHEPEETEYDTAPAPDPPLVASDSTFPYVPEVVVMVSALCATRAIVNEAATYVNEYLLEFATFITAVGVMV